MKYHNARWCWLLLSGKFLFQKLNYLILFKNKKMLFQKEEHRKAALKMYRNQAIMERDLIRLKQSNQKRYFIIGTFIVTTLILAIALFVTLITYFHFQKIFSLPENCMKPLYDGTNFFATICGVCRQGWILNGTACIKGR